MIPFGMCKGPPVKQSLVIYFVQTIKNTICEKWQKFKQGIEEIAGKISVRKSQHCLEFSIASGLLKISR